MTPLEVDKLNHIQQILTAAIAFLMMAEVGYLLYSTVNYLVGVLGALLLLVFYWYTRKILKPGKLRTLFVIGLPLVAISGPFLYVFFSAAFLNGIVLWLDAFLLLCFVIPLAMMLYIRRKVKHMLQDAEGFYQE